jgi:predicted nucleotidyltransferase
MSLSVWGIETSKRDIPNKTLEILFNSEHQLFKTLDDYKKYSILFDDELKALCESVGLMCHKDEINNIFIGLHPCDMEDDQTLREFKEKIKNKLQKIGFDNTEIDYYVDLDPGY